MINFFKRKAAVEKKHFRMYNSLRTLPMLTCIEIEEAGDVRLLLIDQNLVNDIDLPTDELIATWEDLSEKWKAIADPSGQNKVFNVVKEIEFQSNRYSIIKRACESLLFDYDQKMIDLLEEQRYIIRKESYLKDIEKAIREAEGIKNKIAFLQKSLPKQQPNNPEFSIINTMATYVSILGIDFDFNTVSVEKFYAIENQVKRKIAHIEKQNQTLKNTK